MSHRPPKNDRERLQNLVEALAEPGEGDDPFEEAFRAQLAVRGLTPRTWAAEIHARMRARAALEESRRARRRRAVKIAAAVTAGLCVAVAAGVLAVQATRGLVDGAGLQQTIRPLPRPALPDGGR